MIGRSAGSSRGLGRAPDVALRHRGLPALSVETVSRALTDLRWRARSRCRRRARCRSRIGKRSSKPCEAPPLRRSRRLRRRVPSTPPDGARFAEGPGSAAPLPTSVSRRRLTQDQGHHRVVNESSEFRRPAAEGAPARGSGDGLPFRAPTETSRSLGMRNDGDIKKT